MSEHDDRNARSLNPGLRTLVEAPLDPGRVRSLISYDPDTGVLTWNPRPIRSGLRSIDKCWNARFAGKEAGCPARNPRGVTPYRILSIDGRHYRAHRIIWLYMTGEWPSLWIDHADGNSMNNRWSNLRLATPQQSSANVAANKSKKLQIKGVRQIPNGKYRADIAVNGAAIYLGTFVTIKEAAAAYRGAALVAFGAYARLPKEEDDG